MSTASTSVSKTESPGSNPGAPARSRILISVKDGKDGCMRKCGEGVRDV